MANQIVSFKDSNWSLGVDALSTEVDIAEGYVEELENFDPTPEKYLSKRKGYQGVYGNLPVRVVSVEYTTDATANLCLTLDGSIDLSRLSSVPLVVQGRLSVPTAGGDFTSEVNSVHYYPSFSTEILKNFPSGDFTTFIPASEHSLETNLIWVGTSSRTGAGTISNEQFYPNEISIDVADFDISIDTVNGGDEFPGYVYYLERNPSAGAVYVSPTTAATAGTHTVSFTSGTHGLSNNQIITKCFVDTGLAFEEFQADALTINSSGTVSVTFTNEISVNVFFILSVVPLVNSISGTIDSGDTIPAGPKTLIVSVPVSSPFFFLDCYLENGTVLEKVIPNSIEYDDTNSVANVSFTNDGPATSFTMYWLSAGISSNKICLDATVIPIAVDDTRPQLTVWGLDHEMIYGAEADTRAGWVTHIDTYTSEGESFLVAGLGGVFYKGQERDELSAPTWLIPSAYPNLRARISGTVSVGPTFIDITDTTFRTRGNIKGDNLGSNSSVVSSYMYNALTGYVDVVLQILGLTIDGTLSVIINTTDGLEDLASISGAPFSRLNGDWKIKDVGVTGEFLTLSLDIPAVTNSVWNDSGRVGRLGIFSDSVELSAPCPFIFDDIILGESIPNQLPIQALYNDNTTLGLYGVTQQVDFPNAIRIAGSRLSNAIPVRDLNGNSTVAGFLLGDMVQLTGFNQEFRIVDIDLSSSVLVLDEIIRWNDAIQSTNIINVSGRWTPFEAPEDNFSATPSTYPRYMSESPYDDQPFTRSSMANDSMYLSNGIDRPQKIDGVNIYRPGLPRWQTQMFITQNTAAAAVIQLNNISCGFTSFATNKFTVAAADVKTFLVGTRIRIDGQADISYIVTDTDVDNDVIIVDRDIVSPGSSGIIREVCTFNYYFRLNMVDRNNNIIASAATGSEDCVVELTEDTQLRLRLLGLPALDNYDYDRIEVQVYRTKKNGVAPYYLLSTIPLDFDVSAGYIDYVDSDSDEDLRDLDQVNTALKGAELGVAWSQPLRSKFMTSVSNSLIQANFDSDPYLNMSFVDIGIRITPSQLNGFRFLFKKAIDDVLTTSNMTDRVGAEWRNTGDLAVSGITGGVGDFSVTITAHGAVAGDWVYLFRKSAPPADSSNYFAGWWQIASISDANTITINFPGVPGAFTAADDIDRALFASASGDLPVWLGTDYNYSWRREVGSDTAAPYERLAVLRMASALNAGMRMTDTTIAGYESFMPWYVSDAGGEFDIGQLTVRQPLNISTGSSVVLPGAFGDYNLFVNSILRGPDEEIGVQTQKFGSRVLASYQNFPEIMDNPTAVVDSQSDSAVDVNPADGQEITAVIPLFGQAAFGAAQKDQIIVAFKENSIYIVNFTEKRAGRNAVQRIQSENLGCHSPNAVTTTKGGVVYANRSGIYKLDGDMMAPTYLGRRLQRFWRDNVDLSRLDLFTVTNFSNESKVKLSFVYKDETVPVHQFVYNTTKENLADDSALGSWTIYSNWNAIGFSNLDDRNYNATTFGRVFGTRNTGEVSDYRDDSSAITANVLFRAMSFGDEGRRKTIPSAMITYRNQENQGDRDIQVFYAVNMENTFEEADRSELPNRGPVNDLSDTTGKRSVVYKYSFHANKGVYFQIRVINDKIDQALDITNVTYRVGGLTDHGIQNAKG